MTRIGVITFPGTLDDWDAARAVRLAGAEAVSLWHGDADLHGVDAVVLPGGFSYGDYLRAGAIAAFAPVMGEIVDAARRGLPVLGICNGFQVLCEADLLPGAMISNDHLHFVCREQVCSVDNVDTAWTRDYAAGEHITIPLKNGEAGTSPTSTHSTSSRARAAWSSATGLEPNGSLRDIAGISTPTATSSA